MVNQWHFIHLYPHLVLHLLLCSLTICRADTIFSWRRPLKCIGLWCQCSTGSTISLSPTLGPARCSAWCFQGPTFSARWVDHFGNLHGDKAGSNCAMLDPAGRLHAVGSCQNCNPLTLAVTAAVSHSKLYNCQSALTAHRKMEFFVIVVQSRRKNSVHSFYATRALAQYSICSQIHSNQLIAMSMAFNPHNMPLNVLP